MFKKKKKSTQQLVGTQVSMTFLPVILPCTLRFILFLPIPIDISISSPLNHLCTVCLNPQCPKPGPILYSFYIPYPAVHLIKI